MKALKYIIFTATMGLAKFFYEKVYMFNGAMHKILH